jgi:hypothetical protein
MKTCNRCEVFLPYTCFSKDKGKADGLCTICKSCKSEYRKEYYKKNAKKARAYSVTWYAENTQKALEGSKKWRAENREKLLRSRRKAHARRYKENVHYRLSHIMRANVRAVFNDIGTPKRDKTFAAIGYTPSQLRQRIEMNFLPGMSWMNYGEWEIDHKVPISRMLARGETRQKVINALSNLQPMWKADNRIKGNRWSGDNRKHQTAA